MLILASRSPRRAELLRAAGISAEVVVIDVDETPRGGELPEAYVERLAIEKAQAVAALRPGATVIGADTTVVVDRRMLGKPLNGADAALMLRALQGRDHHVLTGVAVVGPDGVRSAVDCTTVWFSPMSDDDIAWYVESGEPMDKAGAYAIQGLASRWIPRIEGSYSNVVGLPMTVVVRLLASLTPDS